MTVSADLKVTSHVGRDILGAAAVFKNEETAVWEYVVNSLQYVDRGTQPKVQVTVDTRNRRIEISDNGRGMSSADLHHFFTMHGENLDRRRGRPGRGKFGTGKSAAFGIANALRVDTMRHGLRNVAVLTRAMIERSTGEDIPVDWQVRDEPTDKPNGTIVIIEDILLKQLLIVAPPA
jgi:HSP90 family molecular chaperone